jgi:Flp pilus assembly protein TadB
MFYILAATVVITVLVVAVAIWQRSRKAASALERVDAYVDYSRIQSRLADACNAR